MLTLERIRPRLVIAASSAGPIHVGDKIDWVYRTVCGLTIEPDPVLGVVAPIPAGGLHGPCRERVVTCPKCRGERN